MLLWSALLLSTMLLQYIVAASPALAVHENGVFELDGNVEDPAGGGDDWNTIYTNGGSALTLPFFDVAMVCVSGLW